MRRHEYEYIFQLNITVSGLAIYKYVEELNSEIPKIKDKSTNRGNDDLNSGPSDDKLQVQRPIHLATLALLTRKFAKFNNVVHSEVNLESTQFTKTQRR